MMAELDDKSGPQAQRLAWEALKKSINGLINKVWGSGGRGGAAISEVMLAR
jgi:hypothetical protein